MATIKQILIEFWSIWEHLKYRIDRPYSILILSFFSILLGRQLLIWEPIKDAIQAIFNSPLNLDPIEYLLLVLLMVSVVWLIVYFPLYKFKSKKAGVLVIPNLLSFDADKELRIILSKLKYLIRKEKLNDVVDLRIVYSKARCPKDRAGKEALDLKKRTGCKMVVWGEVDSGKTDNVLATHFLPIFTYEMTIPPDILRTINRSFIGSIHEKEWYVRENNSKFDRDYLSENLESIALAILGISLFTAQRHTESLRLLKAYILIRKDGIQMANKITEEHIIMVYALSAAQSAFNKLSSDLGLSPGCDNLESKISKSLDLIRDQYEIGLDVGALLLEAQVLVLQNRIDEAEKRISLAVSIYKGTSSSVLVSAAYICFVYRDENSIKKGVYYINSAIKRKNIYELRRNISTVIRWYTDILPKIGSRPQINYPLGLLYEVAKDYDKASKCFQTVVDTYQSQKDGKYESMVYESRKALKRIKKGKYLV